MPMYLERLSVIVMSIKQIQLIEARLRIFSMFPAFKKIKFICWNRKNILKVLGK